MVINVSRGFIQVNLRGKTITIQGEMFFPEAPGKDILGFVLDKKSMTNWDFPYNQEPLTLQDIEAVIEDIKNDFSLGGHILEVE
jgi:hypothetical protein